MHHRPNNLTTIRNIRPWAWTTVSDCLAISTASDISNQGKIRASSFCPTHRHVWSSLGSRACGKNGTRRLTTGTQRARNVFALEAGCHWIVADSDRAWGGPMTAWQVYSPFKDVSEMVLTHRPAVLTHSHTVLRRSTNGKSRLWTPADVFFAVKARRKRLSYTNSRLWGGRHLVLDIVFLFRKHKNTVYTKILEPLWSVLDTELHDPKSLDIAPKCAPPVCFHRHTNLSTHNIVIPRLAEGQAWFCGAKCW